MPENPAVESIAIEWLTEDGKKNAPEAVNLLKQKTCGKINGGMCTNESTQRKFSRPDEIFIFLNASLESIITTLVVDAKYGERDIGVVDVLGAYLHATFPRNKK